MPLAAGKIDVFHIGVVPVAHSADDHSRARIDRLDFAIGDLQQLHVLGGIRSGAPETAVLLVPNFVCVDSALVMFRDGTHIVAPLPGMLVERTALRTDFPIISLQHRQDLNPFGSQFLNQLVRTRKIEFSGFFADHAESEIGTHPLRPGFGSHLDFILELLRGTGPEGMGHNPPRRVGTEYGGTQACCSKPAGDVTEKFHVSASFCC